MEREGIINLLKPAGMTSHDCINYLRKLTGIKRIGHSGTLDPMATGVLVISIGRATRIIEYLENDDKEYLGEMLLGVTTDTQDIWGKAVETTGEIRTFPESIEDIREVFKGFAGEIYQKPPGYSAVRIKGKRLYEYARKGVEIEIPDRQVEIYRLDVSDYNRNIGRVKFKLSCSKGTYVRTLCHEAGIRLGTGAVMSFLLRTGSGVFQSKDAVTLEELKDNYEKYLLPMDYPLGHFGRLTLSEGQAREFCNGIALREDGLVISRFPEDKNEDKYCLYFKDNFLGLAKRLEDKQIFKAEKVLCQ